MRVSEYFSLGRTQPTLDFVDVDIREDVKIFVDPRAIRLIPTEWGEECVALIQEFFSAVLNAIKNGEDEVARSLLENLGEPNETHLGLSQGRSRGRALGPHSAKDVWEALSKSEAARTGLLQDLEDTILMVEGVSTDIVSDISTNLIRAPLIRYTQDICRFYGIPLNDDVDSGPMWDPSEKRWYSEFVQLPMTTEGKLLLVPKVCVRKRMAYDADEYYRHYILEHLRSVELSSNSELVELLKNKRRRVTIKSLKAKYGRGKGMIVRETLKKPDLLRKYRSDKLREIHPPLSHEQLAESEGTEPPNWDSLLDAVQQIPTGKDDASAYEDAVEQLLTALCYPALSSPQKQHRIHDGRKRIDITYSNVATEGFFYWLSQHYPSSHVFVECKNYGKEVGNPELDQLAGRFSPNRGKFGLLVCRAFQNKPLFVERCKDTAGDERGFIVALDDGDLSRLVEFRKEDSPENRFVDAEMVFLKSRFDELIM